MIVKIEIDLSGVYTTEEDGDLSQAIKNAIKDEIIAVVLDHYRKNVSKEFQDELVKILDTAKKEMVDETLKTLVTEKKVKKRYSSNEFITIEQWLVEEFERISLNDRETKNYLDGLLKKSSDSVSKQLKERYDIMFASQIVSKIHEQGMLKEDVAKLLLGN